MSWMVIGSAIWLGILTAISPCPLATNIAAISFIGRQNPDEGKKYGIESIPTQIFYDPDGKELFRHVGFFSKEEILSKWTEFGVDLGKGGSDEKTE